MILPTHTEAEFSKATSQKWESIVDATQRIRVSALSSMLREPQIYRLTLRTIGLLRRWTHSTMRVSAQLLSLDSTQSGLLTRPTQLTIQETTLAFQNL